MSAPSATQQKVLRLEQQVNALLAQVQDLQTTVLALQQAQPVPHDAAANADTRSTQP